MKLSLINESLSSEEIEILDALKRGEIDKGDNLYDSAQAILKKLGTQIMLAESAPDLKDLKKKRRTLSDDEWEKVQDAGATWEDGKSGVWKAEHNGKTYYIANTHRAASINTSLDKTIKGFLDTVKDSS